ncbi:MAG: hypothetical protein IRZ01_05890 [Thermoflavifilum aggregans]|nr:hypothetical protein [Thermoflavifilum aggregans]
MPQQEKEKTAASAPAKGIAIPCMPELLKDDHCDVFHFKRILTYPVSFNFRDQRLNLTAEVILHFRFRRCTLGLTLGDPIYSTTLLPGEKVKLATTDRRSRFTFDSESKLSYRSEQIAEEQYYMTAFQHYMADGANSQSGKVSESNSSDWNFHGDAHGSVGLGLFGGSADASTNANGSHNSSSVLDYLHEQRSHAQASATQAVGETHKAHSLSVGEVSSRTHIEGESEDHFEASSREFSNPNRCHAISFIFYRLHKKQRVEYELEAIERRIKDPVAPVRRPFTPAVAKTAIAFVPQDVAATQKKVVTDAELLSATSGANQAPALLRLNAAFPSPSGAESAGLPISPDIRKAALDAVDKELQNQGIFDQRRQVSPDLQKQIRFEATFSLPTAGVIVKGFMDECDICEPLAKERMQLENDLLRKQIDLLEKSQEYRCCPPAPAQNPS